MQRCALVVALALAGCPGDESRERVKEMDAATFRSILQCGDRAVSGQSSCDGLRDEARGIEGVRIEPTDKGSARYVLTMKNTNIKTVVFAEFPGKITDELTAALIPYSVKPR